MKKQNCWEYKQCGREVGGKNAVQMGICPAAKNKELDGTHEGKFAGRACWVVAGTFCHGKIQGTFADKEHNCQKECDFYQLVRSEEGTSFQIILSLLAKLKVPA